MPDYIITMKHTQTLQIGVEAKDRWDAIATAQSAASEMYGDDFVEEAEQDIKELIPGRCFKCNGDIGDYAEFAGVIPECAWCSHEGDE